jgi:CBS domain-containing protein
MRVKDVMTRTPAYCGLETNLGAAVEILWNRNCGMLPVVNGQGKVVGVITDRDVCVALGTRNRLPGEITVGEILSGKLVSCSSDEDVHELLAKMAEARVRRLPAITADGRLAGIVSIDDVVLRMEPGGLGRLGDVLVEDVLNTLKEIYRPQLPELARRQAAGS